MPEALSLGKDVVVELLYEVGADVGANDVSVVDMKVCTGSQGAGMSIFTTFVVNKSVCEGDKLPLLLGRGLVTVLERRIAGQPGVIGGDKEIISYTI